MQAPARGLGPDPGSGVDRGSPYTGVWRHPTTGKNRLVRARLGPAPAPLPPGHNILWVPLKTSVVASHREASYTWPPEATQCEAVVRFYD